MELIDKKLKCGARLLVLAPFNSELTALTFAFHVGFSHETKENLGISHMAEHLCFSDNDTKTFPEFRNSIQALGGNFNGYTQETMTVYTLELLSDHWKEGLNLLKDIAYHPRFTEDACKKEVKILLAETGQFKQRWLSWFYEKGWYRHFWVLLRDRVWGNQMHNRKSFHRYDTISREMLKHWHKKYYRPDNMTVIAVGNIDVGEVEKLIESQFTEKSIYSEEKLIHPNPMEQNGDSRLISRVGEPFWNQSSVGICSWNKGAIPGEKAACDIALHYLRNKSFDLLRLKHSLAYGTWSFFDGLKNGGFLYLGADVKKGNELRSEKLLEQVINEAKQEDITEKELHSIKNMLLASHARKNANPSWYAMELTKGSFEEYPVEKEDYVAQLKNVTPENIREVLKRLSESKGTLVIHQIPLMSVATTVCAVAGILMAIIGLITWLALR